MHQADAMTGARTGHDRGSFGVDRVGQLPLRLGPVDRVVGRAVEHDLRPQAAQQAIDRVRVEDGNFFAREARIRSDQRGKVRTELPPGPQDDRPQSSCLANPECAINNVVISRSGAGRPTRNPCAASHPASTSTASAARSWSPSATTRRPRLCPSPTAERTMAPESGSDASADTKERSILISLTGSRIRYSSEE